MRKKSFFRAILSVLVILSMLASIPVFAEEANQDSLLVVTEEVPQDVIDYAINNVSAYFYPFELDYGENASDYLLGYPFALRNADSVQYIFPMVKNSKINYLFRVYEVKGQWASVLDKGISDELNQFINDKTPISLAVKNQDIVVTKNGIDTVLSANPHKTDDDIVLTSEIDNDHDSGAKLVEKDLFTPILEQIPEIPATRAPTSKLITLDLKEIQAKSGDNWCAGYSAAQIVRRRTGRQFLAKDVATYAGISSKIDPIPTSDIIGWADDTLAMYVTLESLGDYLYDSTVETQIVLDAPIFLGLNSGYNYHATVLRGYTASVYSIWDPYWRTYYSISKTGDFVYKDNWSNEWVPNEWIIDWF